MEQDLQWPLSGGGPGEGRGEAAWQGGAKVTGTGVQRYRGQRYRCQRYRCQMYEDQRYRGTQVRETEEKSSGVQGYRGQRYSAEVQSS